MTHHELRSLVAIVADSVAQIRGVDVYRLLSSTPPPLREDMAALVLDERPDLREQITESLAEIAEED